MAQVDTELAWSAQGDPVEVPATAAGWRVRRCPPKGGGLERVNVTDQSGPLMVPIECSYKGFCEAVDQVAGKYRLDAVDERGVIVGTTPAYVTVGTPSASSSTGMSVDDALAKSLETIERLAKTNADAMEHMTKDLTAQLTTMVNAAAKLIEAADNAGITTRERAALAAARHDDDDDDEPATVVAAPDVNKPSPWEPLIQALTPLAPQFLDLGIKFAAAKFAAKPAAGAAANGAAAAAAGATTNGTNGTTNGTAH